MHNNININVSGPVQPTSTYKTVVLKGNHSFSSQITKPNIKYVIKHNFDLGGENVAVPANCVLEFDGGSISNGIIEGIFTVLNAKPKCFRNISFKGNFCIEYINSEFFYDYDDDESLLYNILDLFLNKSNANKLEFKTKQYNISLGDTYTGVFLRSSNISNKYIDFNNSVIYDSTDYENTNIAPTFVWFDDCSYITIVNFNYQAEPYDVSLITAVNKGTYCFRFMGESHHLKLKLSGSNCHSLCAISAFSDNSGARTPHDVTLSLNCESVMYGINAVFADSIDGYIETSTQHRAVFLQGCTNVRFKAIVKSFNVSTATTILISDHTRYDEHNNIVASQGCQNINGYVEIYNEQPRQDITYISRQNIFNFAFNNEAKFQNRTIQESHSNINLYANIIDSHVLDNTYPYKFSLMNGLYNGQHKVLNGDSIEDVHITYSGDFGGTVSAFCNYGYDNLRTSIFYNFLQKDINIPIDLYTVAFQHDSIYISSNNPNAIIKNNGNVFIKNCVIKRCNYNTERRDNEMFCGHLPSTNLIFVDSCSSVTTLSIYDPTGNKNIYNINGEYIVYLSSIVDGFKQYEELPNCFKYTVLFSDSSIQSCGILYINTLNDTVRQLLVGSFPVTPYNNSLSNPGHIFDVLSTGSASFAGIAFRYFTSGNAPTNWQIISFSDKNQVQVTNGTYTMQDGVTMFGDIKIDETTKRLGYVRGGNVDLSVVGIVDVNGHRLTPMSGASKPTQNASDIGKFFYDTSLDRPIWHKGNNEWVDSEGNPYNVSHSGRFANKPTGVSVGFKYFCTDKQTTEGATDGIEIIHKGDDVWVDALGRVVS